MGVRTGNFGSKAANGNGDGGDSGNALQTRVVRLETLAERIADGFHDLERELAVVRSNYATNADVLTAKNSIVMWVVSAVLLSQLLPAVLRKFGL